MKRIVPSMLLLLAVGGALVSPRPAHAGQRIERIFERANRAYYRGDFDSAVRGYRKLIQAGVRDADLQYNLATAYARAGEYGRAILHYERTLKLRPGDDDAEQGLAATRTALASQRAERGGEATVSTGRSFAETLVRPFSVGILGWLLLATDVLFFGLLIARRFVHAEGGRLGLGIAAPLAAVLMVLSGLGLAIKTGAFEEGRPAVVLESNAVLREGPDPRAQRRAQALEGQHARILERHDRYVRVRLPGGTQGWMKEAVVEAI